MIILSIKHKSYRTVITSGVFLINVRQKFQNCLRQRIVYNVHNYELCYDLLHKCYSNRHNNTLLLLLRCCMHNYYMLLSFVDMAMVLTVVYRSSLPC